MRGSELETEMKRVIQEVQEETGKAETGALETRTRRIVVKERVLVFYGMSKAQKRRKRGMKKLYLKTQKENIQ